MRAFAVVPSTAQLSRMRSIVAAGTRAAYTGLWAISVLDMIRATTTDHAATDQIDPSVAAATAAAISNDVAIFSFAASVPTSSARGKPRNAAAQAARSLAFDLAVRCAFAAAAFACFGVLALADLSFLAFRQPSSPLAPPSWPRPACPSPLATAAALQLPQRLSPPLAAAAAPPSLPCRPCSSAVARR